MYHPNLSAFGVAVPEGRRLHALGEENFLHAPEADSIFDVGSSGLRNFELATPNSARWCTLALPTLRRLK